MLLPLVDSTSLLMTYANAECGLHMVEATLGQDILIELFQVFDLNHLNHVR